MSKEIVTELADKIYAKLTKVDNATISAPADIYSECLPEELTMETVTQVRQHDGAFIAATTKAVSDYALAAFAADASIEEMSAKVSMGGKDSVTTTILREKEFTNSFAKEGEPKTIKKFGVVSSTVEYQHTRNVGELKAVRAEIAAKAAELLAKG